MHNFREMIIWKESLKLVRMVYEHTSTFPNEEKYGLRSQINRAAVSIPSNIAEGSGRTTNKDFNHFLNIAMSSSYELETQLILAHDIYKTEISELINKLNELQRMMGGFRKTLAA